MKLSDTKLRLLVRFADGEEHTGWEDGAGTLAWAKRSAYITMTSENPRKYRITNVGRGALEDGR